METAKQVGKEAKLSGVASKVIITSERITNALDQMVLRVIGEPTPPAEQSEPMRSLDAQMSQIDDAIQHIEERINKLSDFV
jgi:NifB/MoaA-like Fe-S oxidoreductase